MSTNSTLRLAFPAAAALALTLTSAPAAQGFTLDSSPPLEQQSAATSLTVRPVESGGAQIAATPLSGTAEYGGHTINWALAGASAPPAEIADSYDGVVKAGTSMSFSGSATYVIQQGYSTNLSQSASLTGSDGASFSKYVGGGTYTLPFSLTATAPKPPEYSTAKPGEVAGSLTASVSSRNCNDSGVCGGPRDITIRIAILAGTGDDEKPRIALQKTSKIHADIGAAKARSFGVVDFPFKLIFTMSDNSGKVRGDLRIYSDGKAVTGSSSGGFVKNGKYSVKIKRTPPGAGPFYWCAQAKDPSSNYSPIVCEWLPIAVPISTAGINGCGTAGYGPTLEWLQNYFGDVRTYGTGMDETNVLIRNACNIHDAAYAGVTIFDAIDKRFVNFQPWKRAAIDKKFRKDIQRMCRRDLSAPKRMAPYLRTCLNGVGIKAFIAAITLKGLAAQEDAGANTYWELVRAHGGVGFDADSTTPGTQNARPQNETNPRGGGRNAS